MNRAEPMPINEVVAVKVGTTTWFDTDGDDWRRPNFTVLQDICTETNDLYHEGTHSLFVISGAIAMGMHVTETAKRPNPKTEMHELRRLSTIGWAPLLGSLSSATNRHGLKRFVAGIPVTHHDLIDTTTSSPRETFLSTLHTNLSKGDLPAINENDALADEEIRFGDNDIVSGIVVSQMANSALFTANVRLVLLSDVHGVYERPGDETSVIPQIDDIEDFERYIYRKASAMSLGGMDSKFQAAKIAKAAGIPTFLTHGRTENTIHRALAGEIGTLFTA